MILIPYMPSDSYRYVFDAVVQSCDYGDLPGPLIHTLKQYRMRKPRCEWWMSIENEEKS